MRDLIDKHVNVFALTLLGLFFGLLSLKNPALAKDAVTAIIGALSAIMVQRVQEPPK